MKRKQANSIQHLEDNPKALRGLHQAAYVMSCLCTGEPLANVVQRFQGDNQLVTMWVSFLRHNHWIEFDVVNSSYKITHKGLQRVAREMLTA